MNHRHVSWKAKIFSMIFIVGIFPALALAQEINPESQRELEAFLRENLVRELPKTTLSLQRNGRETSRIRTFIKEIVNHTDWSVRLFGRFVDLENRLFLQVADMSLIGDDTISLTLRAAAPLAGEIWGEIHRLGKTRALFNAMAHLSISAKVRFPETGGPEGRLVFWEASVSDVRIHPDLFGILGAKANEEVNRILRLEDTRARISEAAVNGIRKFFLERNAHL